MKKPALFLLVFLSIVLLMWYKTNSYQYPDYDTKTSTINDIADNKEKFVGTQVKITGQIKSKYSNANGIQYFTLGSQDSINTITLVSFPDQGILNDVYNVGDSLEVTGIISLYKDYVQIEPLSKDHINVVATSENKPSYVKLASFDVSNYKQYLNKTYLIGPVTIQMLEKYSSKAGKTHLRFIISDGNISVNGIMYEGDWNESDYLLMKKSEALYIKCNVAEYQNKISFVVEELKE